MRINCIIIEDSPLAVKKLEEFITQVPGLCLLQTFDNGIEALAFLKTEKVDLIFLDIQMEKLTGLQFIESLNSRPAIIITSAYSEYAVKGFDYDVTAYLQKPFSFERFLKAIDKAETKKNLPDKEYMFVKTEYRMERVDFSDIIYIEGQGAYLRIITAKNKLMTLMNFKQMESLLPPSRFIRIHKSHIVALDKIEYIERNIVKIGGVLLPVGENFKERLYSVLNMKK